MTESKMVEFKMSDIIKLSQNEWVKFFFVQNGWIQDGRIQDGCNHQVDSESMSEVFLCKIAESKMVEFKMAAIIKLSQNKWVKFFFVQTGWIQDGGMKMSGIIKLSENELVWVRGLCKIAESKMAVFKMAAIIKLSENEWVKFFFCSKWLKPRWQNSSSWHHQVEWEWMSLSQIELVWVRYVQNGWIKEGRIQDDSIQDGCHHQVR